MIRHLCHRLWLLLLAALVSLLGCARSSPDRSARGSSPAAGGQATFFLASGSEGGDSWRSSEKLPAPFAATEEPAWLTAALNDPDPKVRIQVLETWAQHPGEKLDPVTHALVDPDESVRARAQELFEEALARK